jgi:hypothetical protein
MIQAVVSVKGDLMKPKRLLVLVASLIALFVLIFLIANFWVGSGSTNQGQRVLWAIWVGCARYE